LKQKKKRPRITKQRFCVYSVRNHHHHQHPSYTPTLTFPSNAR